MVAAILATASLIPTPLLLIRNTPLLLVLLLPATALLGLLYVISRRAQINFGLFDSLLLIFVCYLLIRNETSLALATFCGITLYLYYATFLLIHDKRNHEYLLSIIAGIALIISAYALVEFFFQQNIVFPEYFPRHPGGIYRVTATLYHPVVTGSFLLQAMPFSIALWLRGRLRPLRSLGELAWFLSIPAITLTFSKGSLFTACLIIAGIVLVMGFRKIKKWLIIAGLVSIILLSSGLYLLSIHGEEPTRQSISYDIRLSRWSDVIREFAEKPVAGVGFRHGSQAIIENYKELLTDQDISDLSFPVDNYYLYVLLEEGFIGLLLWLLLLLVILLNGIPAASVHSSEQPWILAAIISVVGFLLVSLTFDSLTWWPNLAMFWITTGILRGLSCRYID